MFTILKRIGLVIGILLILFGLIMFQPWVFIPHKHAEIILPFAASDDVTTGLIPMGEKIEHNASNGNPNGHPGIDFGFAKVTGILSSIDGRIIQISKNSEGSIDVTMISGFYKVTYKEMNSVESNVHLLSKVSKGQLIGYSGSNEPRTKEPVKGKSGQIHWEFSSSSMFLDRLCPVNYFDAESKSRIETIWNNVPAIDRFKSQFPDICNGFFKDRED